VNTKEFIAEKFSDINDRHEQIQSWQERYKSLISQLGSFGTEVEVHRGLQDNKDIHPGHFIRYAAHEFIFPPQEVQLASDGSKVIDHSINGYGLYRESKTYSYDQTVVKGHIRVNYNDSDGKIALRVVDLMDDSELSGPTVGAIEKTFGRTLSMEDSVDNFVVENEEQLG
jgi:hypothetical protein